MKKYLAIISAAILLTGCGSENGESPIESVSSTESSSSIEQTESSVENSPGHTEISAVKKAFSELCKRIGEDFPCSDEGIHFLGKIPGNSEVYYIDTGIECVVTQAEFQGYTIEVGSLHHPSEVGIYILDENGTMTMIEDYQKTHDIKPIYDLLPEGMKDYPPEHTEISAVKKAYLKLCAAPWTEFPGNDDDIVFLGKIPENAEVYSIIPSEKGADAALAQGEFQGYKIETGWQYFPSQFAIYILDENGVMFTVEEYQKTHDFKTIYDLLPEGMKGWSF